MIRRVIEQHIAEAVCSVYDGKAEYTVEYPPEEFGDFATNAPMVIAKKTGRPPSETAENIAAALRKTGCATMASVTVKEPGFVNVTLTDRCLAAYAKDALKKNRGKSSLLRGRKIVVEYTDPNPFKEMHIGHLMSNTVGESFARLAEEMGAEVIRVCYQGDIGVHVAKAIWALKKSGGEITEKTVGAAYAEGSERYEADGKVKKEIEGMNKALYEGTGTELAAIYEKGKKVSLEAFKKVYRRVGTAFDRYIFESEVAPIGRAAVEKHMRGGIFERDAGAIVFRAEKYDPHLHTRVFLTGNNLPTYETKEIGVALYKEEKIRPDASYIVTGSEIIAYMKVVREALKHIHPKIAEYTEHIPHGMLRLPSGKMSSRTGTVVTATAFLDELAGRVREHCGDLSDVEADSIAVAALRYTVLRQERGRDIVFDQERSLSLKGDSGPYLLYTIVRLRALRDKRKWSLKNPFSSSVYPHRPVTRLLYRYDEVVESAWKTGETSRLVTYLTKLAGAVNTWYAEEKILGAERESDKLRLAKAAENTLRRGLHILGITTVERM